MIAPAAKPAFAAAGSTLNAAIAIADAVEILITLPDANAVSAL